MIAKTIAIASALVLITSPALTQEKKIKRSDLPPAVQKAVVSESRGAKIRGFAEEKEKGQTYYETELLVDGHSKDVLMDKDGTVLEVEEQIALNKLLPEVKDGLKEKAGKAKILQVETLTKHGQLMAYEAQVLSHGKKSEVQVGPDGKPLAHEE